MHRAEVRALLGRRSQFRGRESSCKDYIGNHTPRGPFKQMERFPILSCAFLIVGALLSCCLASTYWQLPFLEPEKLLMIPEEGRGSANALWSRTAPTLFEGIIDPLQYPLRYRGITTVREQAGARRSLACCRIFWKVAWGPQQNPSIFGLVQHRARRSICQRMMTTMEQSS